MAAGSGSRVGVSNVPEFRVESLELFRNVWWFDGILSRRLSDCAMCGGPEEFVANAWGRSVVCFALNAGDLAVDALTRLGPLCRRFLKFLDLEGQKFSKG